MTDETRETQPTQEAPVVEEPKTPLAAFVYHQRRACEQAFQALSALIPPDFKEHSREAGKEFVTSFRVLIEGVSEAISRELNRMRGPAQFGGEGSGSGPATTGKTKVKVEVN